MQMNSAQDFQYQPESVVSGDSNRPKIILGVLLALLVLGLVSVGYLLMLAPNSSTSRLESFLQVSDSSSSPDMTGEGQLQDLPPLSDDFSTQATATLMVAPDERIVEVGQQISVPIQLYVSEAGQQIDGVEISANFQPEMVSSVSLQTANTFANVQQNQIDMTSGTIKLILLGNQGEVISSDQPIELGTLILTPSQPGNLTVSFDQAMNIVAASGGNNILTEIQSLVLTVNPAN